MQVGLLVAVFVTWMVPAGHTHILFTIVNVVSTHWHTVAPLTVPTTRLFMQVTHTSATWHKLQLAILQFTQTPLLKVVKDGHKH